MLFLSLLAFVSELANWSWCKSNLRVGTFYSGKGQVKSDGLNSAITISRSTVEQNISLSFVESFQFGFNPLINAFRSGTNNSYCAPSTKSRPYAMRGASSVLLLTPGKPDLISEV